MILEDIRTKMQGWGAAGTFDPFEKIYEVILSLSCTKIADRSM